MKTILLLTLLTGCAVSHNPNCAIKPWYGIDNIPQQTTKYYYPALYLECCGYYDYRK